MAPDRAPEPLSAEIDPMFTAWLASHRTGMHWGCGGGHRPGNDCLVAALDAVRNSRPVGEGRERLRNAVAEVRKTVDFRWRSNAHDAATSDDVAELIFNALAVARASGIEWFGSADRPASTEAECAACARGDRSAHGQHVAAASTEAGPEPHSIRRRGDAP